MIAIIVCALGCGWDAASTVALIRRGGVEVGSAWAIGSRPRPALVWAWVFGLPVLTCAVALAYLPELWLAVVLVGAYRAWQGWRNGRIA